MQGRSTNSGQTADVKHFFTFIISIRSHLETMMRRHIAEILIRFINFLLRPGEIPKKYFKNYSLGDFYWRICGSRRNLHWIETWRIIWMPSHHLWRSHWNTIVITLNCIYVLTYKNQVLRVVQTQTISFFKLMSEKVGSEIERLWISMTSYQIVVSYLCRIRLFSILTWKIRLLGSKLPLMITTRWRAIEFTWKRRHVVKVWRKMAKL